MIKSLLKKALMVTTLFTGAGAAQKAMAQQVRTQVGSSTFVETRQEQQGSCTVNYTTTKQKDVYEVSNKKSLTPEQIRKNRLSKLSPEQRKAQIEKDEAAWSKMTAEQKKRILDRERKKNTVMAPVATDTTVVVLGEDMDIICPVDTLPAVDTTPVITAVPEIDSLPPFKAPEQDCPPNDPGNPIRWYGAANIGGVSAFPTAGATMPGPDNTTTPVPTLTGGQINAELGFTQPFTKTSRIWWKAGVGGSYRWFNNASVEKDLMIPVQGLEETVIDAKYVEAANSKRDASVFAKVGLDVHALRNKETGVGALRFGPYVFGGYAFDWSKSSLTATYPDEAPLPYKTNISNAGTVPIVGAGFEASLQVGRKNSVRPTVGVRGQYTHPLRENFKTPHYDVGAMSGSTPVTMPDHIQSNPWSLNAFVGLDIGGRKKKEQPRQEVQSNTVNYYDVLKQQQADSLNNVQNVKQEADPAKNEIKVQQVQDNEDGVPNINLMGNETSSKKLTPKKKTFKDRLVNAFEETKEYLFTNDASNDRYDDVYAFTGRSSSKNQLSCPKPF